MEASRLGFERSRAPYQTTGRMQLSGPGYHHVFDFRLRWESPVRSRIDITGPLGFNLASAAVGDTMAWLSVPLAGYFLKGTAAMVDSEATARLGFPADAFFRYLEGWPQLAAEAAPQASESGKLVEYRYEFSDTTFSILLDRSDGMPRKLTATASGRPFLEASFADHRPFGAGTRPHRLNLNAPIREVSLEVEFNDLRKAKSFPPETWLPPERTSSD